MSRTNTQICVSFGMNEEELYEWLEKGYCKRTTH